MTRSRCLVQGEKLSVPFRLVARDRAWRANAETTTAPIMTRVRGMFRPSRDAIDLTHPDE
jgi:hypothetical protein